MVNDGTTCYRDADQAHLLRLPWGRGRRCLAQHGRVCRRSCVSNPQKQPAGLLADPARPASSRCLKKSIKNIDGELKCPELMPGFDEFAKTLLDDDAPAEAPAEAPADKQEL